MPSQKYHSLFRISSLWLLIIVLLLGIFFRFAKLENKIFWVDEVATAVRVSGYTISEVIDDLKAKDVVSRRDLLAYQVINKERSLRDSWQALSNSPEHAPLYFLLTRFWLQLWGNSIGVMRSLSAWLSLLIFPCLYWLLEELFNKPFISYLGIAFMSVSPFYVAYAQEARPYSLWTVTILLMGASFLRAIRLNNKQSWAWYTVSLILGFYTSLLSLFIAFFHGIYLLLVTLKNKQQLIKNYIIVSAIALCCFSPWLYIIATKIQTLQDNTTWMRSSMEFTALVATWIGTILLIFGDLPLSPDADAVQIAIAVLTLFIVMVAIFWLSIMWHQLKGRVKQIVVYLGLVFLLFATIGLILFHSYFSLDIVTLIGAIVAVFILALAGYSLFFLLRHSKLERGLFIVCLLISLPLPLILYDIISLGQSSGAPRYFIPTQLAIQIAATYTLGTKIKNGYSKNFKQQKVWQIITILFLTLGVFSCTRNLNLSPIYLKSRNIHNPQIAEIVNRERNPLIVIEPVMVTDVLSLSHYFSNNTKIKLINGDNLLLQYEDFSAVYTLNPSAKLISKFSEQKRLKLERTYQPKLLAPGQITLNLWQIKYY